MTESDSDVIDRPPEPATLETISGQLAELIPAVRKLRRSRWLVWGVIGALVAAVAVGVAGWISYQGTVDELEASDRESAAIRRDLVDRFEAALFAECDTSVTGNANLRTAFNVLVDVAVDPTDPEAVALGRQLNARLDEAVPPRDCVEEARIRAEGG